ncbi:MAG TPA: LptF/LptG family permease, partial [Nitrospirales bacterium]|nr:LptF/LptG family permease [Nitrospirales bacterium]
MDSRLGSQCHFRCVIRISLPDLVRTSASLMLILDRYLIAKYLKMLGVATTALLSIYLTIDFVEQLRKYLKADTQLIDIMGYLGLKLPGILYQLTPLAILLATLITLGTLAYDNEITAMRASGINLGRITA